jgi:acetylornithine aminotransferase
MDSPNLNASLIANALHNDPRVAQAQQLLADALRDHSGRVQGVSPARPELVESYQQLIERLTVARGGAPYFRYLASGIGNGPYVELADGSIKLDFIGGIGVHGLGHSHPLMLEACVRSALEDTVMQGNLQQHVPSLQMCERLLQMANTSGAHFKHCLLSTSGAMANENALKIVLHAKYPANRILAFDNAFAGRSLALASLTDRAKYRDRLPLALPVDYLPFLDPEHPERSTRWAVNELKRLLRRHPGRYAGFWAEIFAGEGGYLAGSNEFFTRLCEPLREAGIPILFDEVQTFTRFSRPFAFQHFELDKYADVVTIGKITQVCATLYREELKPNGPILSQTFTGSSSSIAAGLAVLDALDQAGCFGEQGSNMVLHQRFVERMQNLAAEFPGAIRGPYGTGMMWAWTPYDGSGEIASKLVEMLFQAGLMSFVCGDNPMRIRFLPPPGITRVEHLDAAIGIVRSVLKEHHVGIRETIANPKH